VRLRVPFSIKVRKVKSQRERRIKVKKLVLKVAVVCLIICMVERRLLMLRRVSPAMMKSMKSIAKGFKGVGVLRKNRKRKDGRVRARALAFEIILCCFCDDEKGWQ